MKKKKKKFIDDKKQENKYKKVTDEYTDEKQREWSAFIQKMTWIQSHD